MLSRPFRTGFQTQFFDEFFCASRLSAIRFNPTGIFSSDYPDGLNLNPSVTSIEQGTIDSSD
ncbi:MAG: hypothetical protein EWV82_07005 [Microcystis aeruginosa Ma_AC_P_19900807_S299]|uniref:Uncharacterized protein n=1 Tax=Microcystis aeruginosa Ma_SC_T_19800800_S464 TaxID=2486257 RepID=A0A552DUY6_MICAE|nr:MAG: hypothetical protein EWV82_07005 [Microcystis aeruginosa Ma_AC_P_19900807_S299]TRU26019.1 MAG: hypothetical protein EWV81_10935 [Microcystis aeruginosa Ma_SC_T_19800800_S464]